MGKEMRDNISSLPDDLIHKIFSFLDIKVAVTTCILSTRWRNVWRSVSNINLNANSWGENFIESANQVMLRDDPPIIFKFCLNWTTIEDFEAYILIWLTSVLNRHAQQVHLQGMVLGLQFLNILGSNLNTLKLKKLMFLQEFCDTVECSFKTLECLMIVKCEFQQCRRLIIHTPKLKYLTMDDHGSGISEACIDAPNLEVLNCESWSKLVFLVDMPSLYKSHIGATLLNWILMGESWERESFALRYKDILAAIRDTRALTLYGVDFQILLDFPNVYETSSISFHNVRYLKVTDWSFIGNDFPNLLEYFPSVETLVLQRIDESPSMVERGVLEGPELSPLQLGLSQLKWVEIQNVQGCDDEFMLLSIIIANAIRLERVTLTITGTGAEKRKQLTGFRRRLLLLPRLSKCSRESPEVVIRLYQKKITRENLKFQKRCGCLEEICPDRSLINNANNTVRSAQTAQAISSLPSIITQNTPPSHVLQPQTAPTLTPETSLPISSIISPTTSVIQGNAGQAQLEPDYHTEQTARITAPASSTPLAIEIQTQKPEQIIIPVVSEFLVSVPTVGQQPDRNENQFSTGSTMQIEENIAEVLEENETSVSPTTKEASTIREETEKRAVESEITNHERGQTTSCDCATNGEAGCYQVSEGIGVSIPGVVRSSNNHPISVGNSFILLGESNPVPESLAGIMADVNMVTQRMEQFTRDGSEGVATPISSKNRNSVQEFCMGPRRFNRKR